MDEIHIGESCGRSRKVHLFYSSLTHHYKPTSYSKFVANILAKDANTVLLTKLTMNYFPNLRFRLSNSSKAKSKSSSVKSGHNLLEK